MVLALAKFAMVKFIHAKGSIAVYVSRYMLSKFDLYSRKLLEMTAMNVLHQEHLTFVKQLCIM